MIYFGTLGLLQILALPGLILIKALKIRGGLLERMIYCFPLSMGAYGTFHSHYAPVR